VGGLAVAGGKIYFILIGLVQQVMLKAVLGLEGYGALSSALGAASIAYNPLVAASLQGASHAIATAGPGARDTSLRQLLRVHLALALGAGAAFFAVSPLLSQLTGARHILPSLRLLSAVLVLYGLYAPLVGALNGRTEFGTQAALDVLAATLRGIGLVGGAAWFTHSRAGTWGGIEGATAGFALSSLCVLLVALRRVGVGHASSRAHGTSKYLRFIAPVLLGQLLLNLLFQVDQLLLRRFSADAALSAGLDAAAADRLVGAYRASQLFCFLPYQLVLSVSIVVFPLIARAHGAGDRQAVAVYVRQGMRVALITTGLIVSVTCGLSGPLLGLVFGADTAALGAEPMQILALGLGNLALLGVLTAILNSVEEQRFSLLVTGLAFCLVVVLCLVRVRGLAFGPELLRQTALATSVALLPCTLIAWAIVWRKLGAVFAASSLLRVGAALGLALLVARLLPMASAGWTVVFSGVVASIYVGVLLASKELDGNDWRQLRRIAWRLP
jgi:stage V sporulation protein B